MLYCFIKELEEIVELTDEYMIQVNYAKAIDRYISVSIEKHIFFDRMGSIVCPDPNELYFIRTDYCYLDATLDLFKELNLHMIEGIDEREQITNWPLLKLTKRNILEFKLNDYSILNELDVSKNYFIKSKRKGFSKIVEGSIMRNNSLYYLDGDMSFGESFYIAEYVDILKDEIGNREARFWILDGRIRSCSRYLHSVKHTVDYGFVHKAEEIVELVKQEKKFPSNYVLDIAEMKEHNLTYYDVVEFNPISTSLCYVNNSIFNESEAIIDGIYKQHKWGREFCYDFLVNSQNYFLESNNMAEFVYQR